MSEDPKKPDYKSTLNLPKTDFPMKADLANKEPLTVRNWSENQIYQKMIQKNEGKKKFVLHDGPPYANGHIHFGHILNKVLKDIIVKYKNMAGFQSEYIPGWDCHGLPIEHQVDKDLGSKKKEMSIVEIRQACREYAQKFVNIQREEFVRLGILGDWEHPYLTMNFDYEATIERELGKFVEKGAVYRGRKPVHWCIHCKTALAEAEVEYENHQSPSITVKFPVVSVVGPRQSGKTSLVKELFPQKPYLNLEDPSIRLSITEDPNRLKIDYPEGAILDEIQHVPDVLSYIQAETDKTQQVGFFVLTGSQSFLFS